LPLSPTHRHTPESGRTHPRRATQTGAQSLLIQGLEHSELLDPSVTRFTGRRPAPRVNQLPAFRHQSSNRK
jgi:hypothetical protein